MHWHLTTSELAVISTIAGLLGVLIGGLLARGNAHRDRIAAARTAIHEEILKESTAMAWHRKVATGELPREALKGVVLTDAPAKLNLTTRLYLYGDPEVFAAFNAMLDANGEWEAAMLNKRDLLELGASVERGEVPPHERPTREQLAAAKARLETADTKVDQAAAELGETIQSVVLRPKRFPKLRRLGRHVVDRLSAFGTPRRRSEELSATEQSS